MTPKYYVTNFYRFVLVEDPKALRQELKDLGAALKLQALIILAPEGINGTLTSPDKEILKHAKAWLTKRLQMNPEDFKDSTSEQIPLRQFKVKLRPEIVTLQTPELIPKAGDPSYLTPTQWNEWLKSGKDMNLVDARNHYEYNIGAFKGAIDPKTRKFTQLPDVISSHPEIDKTTPLLMYCTGGIRCEKAVLEMRRRGFAQVYQLHGGILKYLEQYPNDQFEGECFVFDERVAVDQCMEPTKKFTFCPHCGDPAHLPITCERCSFKIQICPKCAAEPVKNQTCSRDCAHHFALRPDRKLAKPRASRFAKT